MSKKTKRLRAELRDMTEARDLLATVNDSLVEELANVRNELSKRQSLEDARHEISKEIDRQVRQCRESLEVRIGELERKVFHLPENVSVTEPT